MNREQQGSQTTKRLIEDAFVYFYGKEDFDKITVSSIAQKCNIARGTFYIYFESTDKLLEDLENMMLEGVSARMDSVVIRGALKDRESYIREYVKMLRFIADNSGIFYVLVTGSRCHSFLDRYHKCIADNVKTLMSLCGHMPDEYTDSLCRFHAGGVVSILEDWVRNRCRKKPEVIADIVYRALFLGILNHS